MHWISSKQNYSACKNTKNDIYLDEPYTQMPSAEMSLMALSMHAQTPSRVFKPFAAMISVSRRKPRCLLYATVQPSPKDRNCRLAILHPTQRILWGLIAVINGLT
jgi:hypothetical protein